MEKWIEEEWQKAEEDVAKAVLHLEQAEADLLHTENRFDDCFEAWRKENRREKNDSRICTYCYSKHTGLICPPPGMNEVEIEFTNLQGGIERGILPKDHPILRSRKGRKE